MRIAGFQRIATEFLDSNHKKMYKILSLELTLLA